jgi:hypothetical protein
MVWAFLRPMRILDGRPGSSFDQVFDTVSLPNPHRRARIPGCRVVLFRKSCFSMGRDCHSYSFPFRSLISGLILGYIVAASIASACGI